MTFLVPLRCINTTSQHTVVAKSSRVSRELTGKFYHAVSAGPPRSRAMETHYTNDSHIVSSRSCNYTTCNEPDGHPRGHAVNGQRWQWGRIHVQRLRNPTSGGRSIVFFPISLQYTANVCGFREATKRNLHSRSQARLHRDLRFKWKLNGIQNTRNMLSPCSERETRSVFASESLISPHILGGWAATRVGW